MREDMSLRGKTALVTGAASGIGRALALDLARRGCALALLDVDAAGLDATRDLLVASPAEVGRISLHVVDVADRTAVGALPDAVASAHGGLDILVNNAGVAVGGTFEEIAPDDFDWLFAVNFGGVVQMTRACLPLLRRSPDAWIVNVSSLFGLIAPPGQTAYVASKFAVRGFSGSLRHELAGSIGVTTVFPGGVATAIAANARPPRGTDPEEAARGRRAFEAMLKLSPDVAAERIGDAVAKRRPQVVIGGDAHFAAMLARLFPNAYWAILTKLMQIKTRVEGAAT